MQYLDPAGRLATASLNNIIRDAERHGLLAPGSTIVEATRATPAPAWRWWRGCVSSSCPTRCRRRRSPTCARWAPGRAVRRPSTPMIHAATTKSPSASSPRRRTRSTPTRYHNPANPRGATTIDGGPEIWGADRQGQFDVLRRHGHRRHDHRLRSLLQREEPGRKLVGVDPIGSLWLRVRKDGSHDRPFVLRRGHRRRLPALDDEPQVIDEIVRVDDKECFLMTRSWSAMRASGGRLGGAAGGGRAVATPSRSMRPVCRAEHPGPPQPDGCTRSICRRSSTTTGCATNGFLTEGPMGTVSDLCAAARPTDLRRAHRDGGRSSRSQRARHLAGASRSAASAGWQAEVDLLNHPLVSVASSTRPSSRSSKPTTRRSRLDEDPPAQDHLQRCQDGLRAVDRSPDGFVQDADPDGCAARRDHQDRSYRLPRQPTRFSEPSPHPSAPGREEPCILPPGRLTQAGCGLSGPAVSASRARWLYPYRRAAPRRSWSGRAGRWARQRHPLQLAALRLSSGSHIPAVAGARHAAGATVATVRRCRLALILTGGGASCRSGGAGLAVSDMMVAAIGTWHRGGDAWDFAVYTPYNDGTRYASAEEIVDRHPQDSQSAAPEHALPRHHRPDLAACGGTVAAPSDPRRGLSSAAASSFASTRSRLSLLRDPGDTSQPGEAMVCPARRALRAVDGTSAHRPTSTAGATASHHRPAVRSP